MSSFVSAEGTLGNEIWGRDRQSPCNCWSEAGTWTNHALQLRDPANCRAGRWFLWWFGPRTPTVTTAWDQHGRIPASTAVRPVGVVTASVACNPAAGEHTKPRYRPSLGTLELDEGREWICNGTVIAISGYWFRAMVPGASSCPKVNSDDADWGPEARQSMGPEGAPRRSGPDQDWQFQLACQGSPVCSSMCTAKNKTHWCAPASAMRTIGPHAPA